MSIYIRRIVIGIAMAAMVAMALADEPIVIKFSHVVAADTPKGQAAEFFKRSAEQRTQGRVRVDLYPDSKLYADQVELAALELGAVQMLAPSISKIGTLGIRDFEVFDLPFLFQDYSQVHRVTQGMTGQAMLRKLERNGIIGLAFWDNGFKQISANRALRTPVDLRGLRMRIQPSRVLSTQMRALGSMPQPMAFSDVYQAMRAGVVDGTENTLSNFYTQRMYQVQSHLTLSNHGYLGYVVMVNKKFWDGLPGDIRDALTGAVNDATRFGNDIARRKNQEALAAIARSKKTEIIFLSASEKKQWVQSLLPVHQEQAHLIGKDLIQSIYQETGFDSAKYARDMDTPSLFNGERSAAGTLVKWWSKNLLATLKI